MIIKIIKETGENKGGNSPLKQPAITPNKALEQYTLFNVLQSSLLKSVIGVVFEDNP